MVLPYDSRMLAQVPEVAKLVIAKTPDTMYWVIVAVCAIGLLWAVWQSKHETLEMRDT